MSSYIYEELQRLAFCFLVNPTLNYKEIARPVILFYEEIARPAFFGYEVFTTISNYVD